MCLIDIDELFAAVITRVYRPAALCVRNRGGRWDGVRERVCELTSLPLHHQPILGVQVWPGVARQRFRV